MTPPRSAIAAPGRHAAPATAVALALLLGIALSPSARAAAPDPDAQAALGERLGAELDSDDAAGVYLHPDGRLRAKVVSGDAEQLAVAAGVQTEQVGTSLADLERAHNELDPALAPVGVSWGPDVLTNSLAIAIPDGAEAASAAFVTAARATGVPVTIEHVGQVPTLKAFFGGDRIARGPDRCTAGFLARNNAGTNYVITAGHCLGGSGSWFEEEPAQEPGPSFNFISAATRRSFPGNDYGTITVAPRGAALLDARGAVIYNGAPLDIDGVAVPPPGYRVALQGSFSGTQEGELQRYGQSVVFGTGSTTPPVRVDDLIQTNICSRGGDSGGPLFRGTKAIGTLVGGNSFPCGHPDARSWYQPIGEVLTADGLTLR